MGPKALEKKYGKDNTIYSFAYIASTIFICVGQEFVPLLVRDKATESFSFKGEHACCGERSLSSMGWMGHKQFVHPNFLLQLTVAIRRFFHGGNVSFILNTSQRKYYRPMLTLMSEVGKLTEIAFRNHNMNTTNYLYLWDFQTSKKGLVMV